MIIYVIIEHNEIQDQRGAGEGLGTVPFGMILMLSWPKVQLRLLDEVAGVCGLQSF